MAQQSEQASRARSGGFLCPRMVHVGLLNCLKQLDAFVYSPGKPVDGAWKYECSRSYFKLVCQE